MTAQDRTDLERILGALSTDQRRRLFERLRDEFRIHTIETEWNTTAESILEAIQRSSDLTRRGIRGILAEASFFTAVIRPLLNTGWDDVTPAGDASYDLGIRDDRGEVRVQVKLQRRAAGQPMRGDNAPRRLEFSGACFVVETQRTRAGLKEGKSTRPYRFGEFDVLAVSLHPSTGNWNRFRYTVAAWLLHDPDDERLILKYQPVPPAANGEWTDDFERCIEWFRSGVKREIRRAP